MLLSRLVFVQLPLYFLLVVESLHDFARMWRVCVFALIFMVLSENGRRHYVLFEWSLLIFLLFFVLAEN